MSVKFAIESSSRSLLAAAGLAVGLFAVSPVHAAPETAVVTAPLNLRAAPGTMHGVVTKLPAGAIVRVEGCQEDWCAVTWQEWSGFAHANYLDMSGAGVADPRGPHAPPADARAGAYDDGGKVAAPKYGAYPPPPRTAALPPPPPGYYDYPRDYYYAPPPPRYYVPYGYYRPYPYYQGPSIVLRFGDRPRRHSRRYHRDRW